jgi:myosin-5
LYHRLARKNYQKQRRQIVLVQSCVRRRQARKALLALKVEARSVTHFKEVSYKLESKVVELTQNLTEQKSEKKKLADKAAQLEGQIKSWTEKYEKMEKKAKGYEVALQEPTVPKADFDKLQSEKDSIHTEHQSASQKLKSHELKITKLQKELEQAKEEIATLKEEAAKAPVKSNEDANVDELKSQISSLKAQLALALNAPRRQQSGNNLRSPSPAPDRLRGISPPPPPPSNFDIQKDASDRGRSPTGVPVPRKVRRNSSAELSKGKPKTSIDNIRQTELHLKNHRPTSVDHFSSLLGGKHDRIVEESDGDPEEGIHLILTEEENLLEEIVDGLIKELKMPLPSLQNPPSQKEVLFPAHMIGLCVSQMWKLGYMPAAERLLLTVMDTIQKQCLSFTDDEAVVPCAFWLSNVHELLSIICSTEITMEQEMRNSGKRTSAWQDFEKMVATIKYELQCLEDNVFHAWMKELKKRLSKMIVPSIVESQSLPGFITSDSGRFLNKLLAGGSHPTYSMDDLLNFLNKVWRAMKCYYLEQSISRQVLTELLKLLGASAFNDLLMRKNFCSWKRGKTNVDV